MANWTFDATQYEEKDFAIVPAGDHRVRIADVEEKISSNSNEMYEIILEVSGHNSKLWFYLVLDKNDPKKTNQRIGDFFNSFGVTGSNLGNGKQWIGKVGAVRVKHEEYNNSMSAKVAYCINRKNQDKLPPAKFSGNAAAAPTILPPVNESELPF